MTPNIGTIEVLGLVLAGLIAGLVVDYARMLLLRMKMVSSGLQHFDDDR